MQELRECRSCGDVKPIGMFAAERRAPSGRRHICNACKYRSSIRGAPSHTTAGCARVTLAEERALVAAQGGACALCGTTARRLVLDHDHATGAARGMLCHGCNRALAALGIEDDFDAAVDRLRRYLRQVR